MLGVAGCQAWLAATRRWTSRLHHFAALPQQRVRALLVGGADPLATDGSGPAAQTPVSLARALLAGDEPPPWPSALQSAQLVVDAAGPWSTRTHALFPPAVRARAVELLLLGHLLARDERFAESAAAIIDVWEHGVLPRAVCRPPAQVVPMPFEEDAEGSGSDEEDDLSGDDDSGQNDDDEGRSDDDDDEYSGSSDGKNDNS